MKVSSLKLRDLTIKEFFTKLKVIWDELGNFIHDPICSYDTK